MEKKNEIKTFTVLLDGVERQVCACCNSVLPLGFGKPEVKAEKPAKPTRTRKAREAKAPKDQKTASFKYKAIDVDGKEKWFQDKRDRQAWVEAAEGRTIPKRGRQAGTVIKAKTKPVARKGRPKGARNKPKAEKPTETPTEPIEQPQQPEVSPDAPTTEEANKGPEVSVTGTKAKAGKTISKNGYSLIEDKIHIFHGETIEEAEAKREAWMDVDRNARVESSRFNAQKRKAYLAQHPELNK